MNLAAAERRARSHDAPKEIRKPRSITPIPPTAHSTQLKPVEDQNFTLSFSWSWSFSFTFSFAASSSRSLTRVSVSTWTLMPE